MCCCAGDEGFVALRRRSAGSGVKPPHGALAEDFVNMDVEAGYDQKMADPVSAVLCE